ncbi:hypothetical protein D2E70_16270 [Mycobacteroides abscessus]|uniref:hypothetical protein n=1 Tax=Mycobacteroides abscessus TaxID=36809 RepID=UPI000E69F453|nr:hypothetical protein [Mycobacteroides abscessus]RIS67527.1 hypothetical protein D2E70_16270 [Mycobacteroides abscessus]
MTYSDPDLAFIYDRAAKAGSSPRITDTAGQVSGTSSKLVGATDGGGPERFMGDASEIGKALASLATDAAIATDIWGDLKKSADAWNANAPKAAEMNAAEKAVTDAQAKAKTAREAADAAPDDKELADAADKAGQEVIDAKTTLIDLQRKRKEAVKALLGAISRAIAKAKRITGGQTKVAGDGTTGVTLPGQSTGNGTQSTGSGNPAARTTGTDKPAGTPAATPGTGKPAETTTSTSSAAPTSKPDPGIANLLSSLNQQSAAQQQPQQAAAAQPTAAQQPAATAPQNQQGQNKNQRQEGVIDLEDVARELGETPGTIVAGLGGTHGSPSTSSPSPTPAAQQASTPLRPEFKPPSLAATAAQNPVTSGTSQVGLTTPSDVGGRAQGSERTAYTDAAPKTTTSAAHTDTTQRPGETQQGRPVTGGGMPVGGMPIAPGAPAPASRQASDGDRERGVASTSDPLGLMHERGDAVDGGTIAQNRDKPAA